MPLTPADVRNVAFKKPPMGKRGYDEEEVDAFLDEVERELVGLYSQITDLNEQIAQTPASDGSADPRLAEELAALQEQFEQVRQEKALAEHHVATMQGQVEQAQQEKAAAEENARRMQAEAEAARSQAAQAPAGGEQQALRVLAMAQRTADEAVRQARSEAEALLSDAQAKVAQMVTEAEERAATLDREARERHEATMGNLDADRAALEARIAELRTFEAQYRARLTALLEGSLRDLGAASQAA